MLRRALIGLLVSLAAGVGASEASASPLWSYTPSSFTCGAGGKIVPDNSCVQGTGFNPKNSYWGQYKNSVGNCTDYVAYRLSRNGASNFLKPGEGSARYWKGLAEAARIPVNRTPAVGSVAWFQPGQRGISSAGHIAYVEKVANGGKTIYLSESHFPAPEYGFSGGSRRIIVKSGDRYWPSFFLHVRDQPSAPPVPAEATPSPSEEHPAPAPTKHIYHVHNTCADNSCGLLVETAPGSRFGGKVIGTLKDGTAVNIRCQTVGGMVTGGEGSNDVWDQIDYGSGVGYVADLYIDTPGNEKTQAHRYFTSSIPKC